MEDENWMQRGPRTLLEHVSRSLTVAGIAWGAVVLYVAPPALLADIGEPPQDGDRALNPTMSQFAWTEVDARRYRHCVGIDEWGTARRPTAVVVLRRNGEVRRMAWAEALRRTRSASAADDVWTVGACR